MFKWQGFYSTNQVSRLAGIPKRTLYLWKKRGIISPSVRVVDADGNVNEGYSYADLAIVKVLQALKVHKLNLRSTVIAFRHLYERFGFPTSENWADAHVYVINRHVYAQKPDKWETTLATKGGQKAEMRVLGELVEEEGALLVPKQFSDYVEINPDVMDGEPIIKDTRVPTSMLATLSAEGMIISEITKLYSPVPARAVEYALAFERNIEEKYSQITKTRTLVN
jgi:uncharacterized protein (DUF433 family)